MAPQPRGKPRQSPPPAGWGRNALTALGSGVLVLAVAGGAWALLGRDGNKTKTTALGAPVSRATVSTSTPTAPVLGPKVPAAAETTPAATAASPTSLGPVAAATASTIGPIGPPRLAATATPKPVPTKVAVSTSPTPVVTTPAAAPTRPAPVASKPAEVAPPARAPQQAGRAAKVAYTFRIAPGDTLWHVTKTGLAQTGRSTSNANVATYLQKMYASNRAVIGPNPNLIVPGQAIVWPAGL